MNRDLHENDDFDVGKVSLTSWMLPYSLTDNIFDSLFPDLNDVDEKESAESLADLLIDTYITSHNLEAEQGFKDQLIAKLENDWDRLLEHKNERK